VKTCRACNKPLEPKPGETVSNFKKREFCNRTCLAHYKHGTTHKLIPRVEPRVGDAPKRLKNPTRLLMQRAIEEHPELPQFLLQAVQRAQGVTVATSDSLIEEVSWG
jgi:hypothetical protein